MCTVVSFALADAPRSAHAAIDAACEEDGIVSPTSIPPGTMTISKTTMTSALFERMACTSGRCYDEGLSERSDKSIYDEKGIFVAL